MFCVKINPWLSVTLELLLLQAWNASWLPQSRDSWTVDTSGCRAVLQNWGKDLSEWIWIVHCSASCTHCYIFTDRTWVVKFCLPELLKQLWTSRRLDVRGFNWGRKIILPLVSAPMVGEKSFPALPSFQWAVHSSDALRTQANIFAMMWVSALTIFPGSGVQTLVGLSLLIPPITPLSCPRHRAILFTVSRLPMIIYILLKSSSALTVSKKASQVYTI